jgi:hypothetical protein
MIGSINLKAFFHMGCKFDTPHRLKMYAQAAKSSSLITGIQSLAEYETLITDQGPTGSCESHSGAMATWIDFAAQSNTLSWFPSPDAWYKDLRCQERTPNSDGSLPPLQDSGGMTSDAVTVAQTCGLKAIGQSVDGRNSDVDPNTVNDEPKLSDLDVQTETSVLIDPGAESIDLSDTTAAIATIQQGLLNKHPVRIDIICDSIFQNYFQTYTSTTPPIDSCNPNDPTAGGHAIVLDEVQVNTDGSIILAGPNSWGMLGAPSLVNGPNKSGHWQGTANWFKIAVQGAFIWSCKKI